MQRNIIYFFIEGNDDERFIKYIIEPIITNYFNSKTIQYAQQLKKNTIAFIDTFNNDENPYFFLKDINSANCPTEKKASIIKDYRSINQSAIIVVIREIEAWYLAGLDSRALRSLGFKECTNTNLTTKELYNTMKPKNINKIILLSKIIENYSIETAKNKNLSFLYFISKIEKLIGKNIS